MEAVEDHRFSDGGAGSVGQKMGAVRGGRSVTYFGKSGLAGPCSYALRSPVRGTAGRAGDVKRRAPPHP